MLYNHFNTSRGGTLLELKIDIFNLVNKKTIENFMEAFFNITRMLVSFADENHKQYSTFYAGSRCEFCRIMNSSAKGLECCISTSREGGGKAAISKKPLKYRCHAGLTEIVVPIIVNGKHIGSVFSGQIFTCIPEESRFEEMKSKLEKLGIYDEATKKAYMDIPVLPEWKLDLVSKLLTIIVDYIVETEINTLLKEQVDGEKEKLLKILPYLENEFVNYIINDNTDKLMELESKAGLLGLDKVPNAALCIKINDYDEIEKQHTERDRLEIKSLIFNAVKSEIAAVSNTFVHSIDDDKLIVLFYVLQSKDAYFKKKEILNMAERIRKAVKITTSYTVTIGAGRCYEDSMELGKSYREAFNAQLYEYIAGKDKVIHIDDIIPENSNSVYRLSGLDKLKDAIRLGDKSKVLNITDKIITQLYSSNESYTSKGYNEASDTNRIKAYITDILNDTFNLLLEEDFNASSFSRKIICFRELFSLSTRDDIRIWIKNIISTISDDIAEKRTTRNEKSIKKVKAFIKQNHNVDLSLEEVAANVFLSPNYFSWLFKKETGMTYVEYLTKVRIERAKNLIETTGEPISKISGEVGYQDSNYFSQVFKKLEGMSPSAYLAYIRKMSSK